SHADAQAVLSVASLTSLTVVPTHVNRDQVRRGVGGGGAAYPQLDETTCRPPDEAPRGGRDGLSFQRARGPQCKHRRGCKYRAAYDAARGAKHTIATHRRAEMSMPELMSGREYIAIHEIPHDLLRPMEVIRGGFRQVVKVARHARSAAGSEDGRFYG